MVSVHSPTQIMFNFVVTMEVGKAKNAEILYGILKRKEVLLYYRKKIPNLKEKKY